MSKPSWYEGQLDVFVVEARKMPDKEMFSRQDPYVLLRLGHTGQVAKTKTRREGGRNVTWNQSVSFVVSEVVMSGLVLHIQVMDANVGKDRLIGQYELNLNSMVKGSPVKDSWYSLKDAKGKPAGEIRLDIAYKKPAAPPGGAMPPQPESFAHAASGVHSMPNLPSYSMQPMMPYHSMPPVYSGYPSYYGAPGGYAPPAVHGAYPPLVHPGVPPYPPMPPSYPPNMAMSTPYAPGGGYPGMPPPAPPQPHYPPLGPGHPPPAYPPYR